MKENYSLVFLLMDYTTPLRTTIHSIVVSYLVGTVADNKAATSTDHSIVDSCLSESVSDYTTSQTSKPSTIVESYLSEGVTTYKTFPPYTHNYTTANPLS
jgi:hypothetical protein